MVHKKLGIDDELESLQRESFDYFKHEVNPLNGLVRDKTAENWPASIAATGLALASYPIAVERGFMTRQEAIKRTLKTLRFFWSSPQGPEPDATGYKGFYYHFLDMNSGRRAWSCELSTVDTTFLLAGMLTAGIFFDKNVSEEQEIRSLSDELYVRVDWRWAQNHFEAVTHGWKPETGFLPYRWNGYDEAMLLYVLGLGSPTYPLPTDSYAAWTRSYEWRDLYGYQYLHASSLFTHQFSHIWLDFKNIQDDFMSQKSSDYFENSRVAALIQQQYAIRNPLNFVGYSSLLWGLTASDGPGPKIQTIDGVERRFYDYVARGVPDGPDDGTVAPWAAIASLPFAPEIVLPLIQYCVYDLKLKEGNPYGFKASLNQTHRSDFYPDGWVSPWHYGINQGPIVLMVENFRTKLIWKLMRKCPYVINGLRRAGFTGGYLSQGGSSRRLPIE